MCGNVQRGDTVLVGVDRYISSLYQHDDAVGVVRGGGAVEALNAAHASVNGAEGFERSRQCREGG